MGVDRPEVRLLRTDGQLVASWEAPVVAGHGLTIVRENGEDLLWIADNGISAPPGRNGMYDSQRSASGQYGAAVKLTLAGEELLRLSVPKTADYAAGNFAPTDVAVDERRHGGSGSIWVADGYGRHLLHRYDEDGRYLGTLDGVGGLGRFDQPHAVFVDRRKDVPQLYVADRGNARIQVFGLDGQFIRGVGRGHFHSPGGFAVTPDGHMFVAELDARVTILDRDDEVVGVLGEQGPPDRGRPGWPNRISGTGRPERPVLRAGKFNSPHAIAADRDGNLYIAEWLIGGRTISLERVR
jgi:hypothetical protein